jgi:hypothetical protein
MNVSSDDSIEAIISDAELGPQLKELVLERISVMPSTMRIVIGTTEVVKEDIVNHVKDEDDIGKQMMEMELDYLRDQVSGVINQ